MRHIALAAMLCTALAGPVARLHSPNARDIIQIDPSTNTCAGAPAAAECRTASQAAVYIAAGFSMFQINDFYTQAALLSLILYESGSFKYSQNHFPGIAGQGTRNMQSPAFNAEYASLLVNVKNSGISGQALHAAQLRGPAAVLELVNNDLWGFSSAAWFFTTHCADSVKTSLASGTQAGWSAYMTQCVGTAATDERTQIWHRAVALGQWSN